EKADGAQQNAPAKHQTGGPDGAQGCQGSRRPAEGRRTRNRKGHVCSFPGKKQEPQAAARTIIRSEQSTGWATRFQQEGASRADWLSHLLLIIKHLRNCCAQRIHQRLFCWTNPARSSLQKNEQESPRDSSEG